MPEETFWRSTPFQTRNFIEAAGERRLDDYKVAMWQAWHAAGFGRVKKMPSLDEAMRGLEGKKSKRMTADQLLQAFEMINIRTGGKDLRKMAH